MNHFTYENVLTIIQIGLFIIQLFVLVVHGYIIKRQLNIDEFTKLSRVDFSVIHDIKTDEISLTITNHNQLPIMNVKIFGNAHLLIINDIKHLGMFTFDENVPKTNDMITVQKIATKQQLSTTLPKKLKELIKKETNNYETIMNTKHILLISTIAYQYEFAKNNINNFELFGMDIIKNHENNVTINNVYRHLNISKRLKKKLFKCLNQYNYKLPVYNLTEETELIVERYYPNN